MTMDIALALAAPAANAEAPQPAASGQEAAADTQTVQFGRILVARVADAGGNAASQHAQTQAAPKLTWKLSSGEWTDLVGGATGEALVAKLDELLRLAESGEPLTQAQRAEIDEVLDELQALMAALFGIALPLYEHGETAGQTADQVTELAAGMAADPDISELPTFRSGLHETIAFVRSFLAEGAFRPLTKQENALFDALIGRLQRALVQANDAASAQDGAAENQTSADHPVVTVETRTSAESMLARLARQPVQASVAAILTGTQRQGAAQTATAQNAAPAETAPNSEEAEQIAQLPTDAGDQDLILTQAQRQGAARSGTAQNMALSAEAETGLTRDRNMQSPAVAADQDPDLTEAQRPGTAGLAATQNTALTENAAGGRTTGQAAQSQTVMSAELSQTAASETDMTPFAQSVQPAAGGDHSNHVRSEAPVRQPVPTVPADRFHELVSGMAIRQMKLSSSGGVSEARILLVPEHLGEVSVRITLQNGQLTAQFVTENAAAKELIENQFVVLRGVLQSQGIQVERLEVTQGNAAAQSQMFQEQRQRGGQSRQEGGKGKRGEESFAVFESELIEQAAIRELGYGRAINVKA